MDKVRFECMLDLAFVHIHGKREVFVNGYHTVGSRGGIFCSNDGKFVKYSPLALILSRHRTHAMNFIPRAAPNQIGKPLPGASRIIIFQALVAIARVFSGGEINS